MLVSPREVATQRFDYCIIGAGAAGIISALELCRLQPRAKILLVEFGLPNGCNGNSLDDSIRIANQVNHHPPYECTNKGLGGTTATWGGRCVMYDEVDFLPRPIIGENCTWDAALFREIQSFIPQARDYFECGSGPFRLDPAMGHIAEHFASAELEDNLIERWSMPTRFGPRYREQLQKQENLYVLTGYEARSFLVNRGRAETLTVRDTADGTESQVNASSFIVATGAQEATRLLLRNPQLFAQLGSPPSSLGKYYQGHVSGKIASIVFKGDPKKTEFGFRRDGDGTYIRRRFQFTTASILRHNLLNTAFWLDNPLYFDPSHRSGAMSLMYLAMITPVLGKRLAPPAIAHSVTKGKVHRVGSHVSNIVRGLPASLVIPATTFWQRYCRKRKLPGVFLYSPQNRYALHFHAEQIPVADNSMELAADAETLVIHYELTDDDITSVIRGHELLDQELQRSGCGRLEYWFPEQDRSAAIRQMSRDGVHQCGTTRIANSPEHGVLDRDLRVWGCKNVYVCSSSAFPTSGQANPTFLIGVFAARLARHLMERTSAAN